MITAATLKALFPTRAVCGDRYSKKIAVGGLSTAQETSILQHDSCDSFDALPGPRLKIVYRGHTVEWVMVQGYRCRSQVGFRAK